MPPHGATPWGKRLGTVVHEDEPFNAEPAPDALLRDPLTATNAFYSRNHGTVPEADAATWRLEVDGLVERPYGLVLPELQRIFDAHTLTATLQCAGNRRAGLLAVRAIPGETPWREGAISTATWTGARLGDILAHARVRDDPDAHVAFDAPDHARDAKPPQPYGSSVPLSKALADEVLLAWEMNGEPLPAVHGGPLRVVVPGYVGARSVKWIRRVTVQAEPSTNYFQRIAYRLLAADAQPGPGEGFALGPVALNCAILDPPDRAEVEAGSLAVRGYALAGGDRRLVRVDVSGDSGATWFQADLGIDAGPWAWRLWSATVHVAPGHTRVMARAWDDSGMVQPRDPADVWNPKGYVNNSWPVIGVYAR